MLLVAKGDHYKQPHVGDALLYVGWVRYMVHALSHNMHTVL